jgi:hypothetical protein
MASNTTIVREPAPWQLKGEAYILVTKFNPWFVKTQGFIPPALKGRYTGGFGVVMFVDYHQSNVGPYQELLFVPGLFSFGNKRIATITKIYVSTQASVINGQANWGIPKELAKFKIDRQTKHIKRIRAQKEGQVFADFTIKTSPWGLKLSSSLLPKKFKTLAQPYSEQTLIVTPSATGKMSRAQLVEANITSKHFPDFSCGSFHQGVYASPFTMRFPTALPLDTYLSAHSSTTMNFCRSENAS